MSKLCIRFTFLYSLLSFFFLDFFFGFIVIRIHFLAAQNPIRNSITTNGITKRAEVKKYIKIY